MNILVCQELPYHLEQLLDHSRLAACLVEWPMFDRLCEEQYSLDLLHSWRKVVPYHTIQCNTSTTRSSYIGWWIQGSACLLLGGPKDAKRVWCVSRRTGNASAQSCSLSVSLGSENGRLIRQQYLNVASLQLSGRQLWWCIQASQWDSGNRGARAGSSSWADGWPSVPPGGYSEWSEDWLMNIMTNWCYSFVRCRLRNWLCLYLRKRCDSLGKSLTTQGVQSNYAESCLVQNTRYGWLQACLCTTNINNAIGRSLSHLEEAGHHSPSQFVSLVFNHTAGKGHWRHYSGPGPGGGKRMSQGSYADFWKGGFVLMEFVDCGAKGGLFVL